MDDVIAEVFDLGYASVSLIATVFVLPQLQATQLLQLWAWKHKAIARFDPVLKKLVAR